MGDALRQVARHRVRPAPRYRGVQASVRAALAAPPADRPRTTADLLAALGRRHDALGLTEPLDATPGPYFDRPYPVVRAERFSDALLQQVTDPRVRALPRDVGSIDTLTDSVPALADHDVRERLRTWWRVAEG